MQLWYRHLIPEPPDCLVRFSMYDTFMLVLAAAAFSAGLAIGHPWLALFLVFCASCTVDVKTPIFFTAAVMATAGSSLVLFVPFAAHGALPLAAIAFAVQTFRKSRRHSAPPTPTAVRKESPITTFASLL